ncbi:MAG: 50S ribosomal protein L25 [Verrucomicrobiae bacterium]|nr:50S ribosomal protein L25 [Verrucomicrobiae bacterium]
MQQIEIKAQPRTEAGRNKVKHLRRKGVVPGVVYGAHRKPESIQLRVKEIMTVIHKAHSEHVLVELKLDENAKGRLALLQGVQHDPISREILHVDFQELREDEKFTVSVVVQPIGEPVGVRMGGGVLEYVMRELRVRCLPKDLPERIAVDVTNLEIGKNILVGDITPPAGVEFLDDKVAPVVAVVAPTVEEEPTPAEGATAVAEVEVLKEKKGEEGEEAAPAAKGKADAKPGAKGEAKPGAKGDAKPEAKGDAKAGAGKGDAKPEAKKK